MSYWSYRTYPAEIDMDQLNIPVLLGTNRKERQSVHVAKWLVGQMERRPEIRTRLFDVADF